MMDAGESTMLKFAALLMLALAAVLTIANASTPKAQFGPGPAPFPKCPAQCM